MNHTIKTTNTMVPNVQLLNLIGKKRQFFGIQFCIHKTKPIGINDIENMYNKFLCYLLCEVWHCVRIAS
jgi:hypothetical protein